MRERVHARLTACAQAIKSIEAEDDLSPLRAALEKAKERSDKLTETRKAHEDEALFVAEEALRAKDVMLNSKAMSEETLQLIGRKEELLSKLGAQKDIINEEMQKLLQQEEDALASVDGPIEEDGAAVGDWDINTLKSSARQSGEEREKSIELSDDEKRLLELKAAMMIIDERVAAIHTELAQLQGKLEALDERLLQHEQNYADLESNVAAAMIMTEQAVKAELEGMAVYKQVRAAVEQAESAFRGSDAGGSMSTMASIAQDEDVALVSEDDDVSRLSAEEQAKAQIAQIELEASGDAESEAAEARQKAIQAKVATVVVAIAAAVLLCLMTPLGAWLEREVTIVSVFVQKVTALFTAICERVPWPQPHHGEEGLWEAMVLLLTSVVAVPTVIKFIPGGSAVLGFLIGGAVIGPHGLAIIKDIEPVRHLGEMGVVFLLFKIGLELSLERLKSMAKMVFGLGNLQFVVTTLAIAAVCVAVAGWSGPTSIIVGGALALSSTAVAMQVLQERGEQGTRHGRITFAILLLQDLAVVVLLMLVPLLAQGSSGGLLPILKALGVAAMKGVVCISAIIFAGRTFLRPLMQRMASLQNQDILVATTLLVVLGSSVLTQIAGLSLALGAFLAGLLMAETEYALQVESDIEPYKGLLMGLFFICVGMEISVTAFLDNWPLVFGSLAALILGKTAIVTAIAQPFGFSRLSALRSALYIAPGGEFAFVVLNEAVAAGLLPNATRPTVFFMVVLSMAITPYLATMGAQIGKMLESKDVSKLQPNTEETKELKDHVIIMGFGRVGQIIAQLLSERLIPFVALDVRADRVQAGKEHDLPVYFGDAGSPAVLEHVGASRAKCAVITLDTPGANYRAVWAMNKNFPGARIYVRAHDVEHGLNLEKAGASAVIPEILEPSLQLAAAVLSSLNLKPEEVSDIVDSFRRSHMAELKMLTDVSGGTLGYGFDKDRTGRASTADSDPLDDILLAQPADSDGRAAPASA